MATVMAAALTNPQAGARQSGPKSWPASVPTSPASLSPKTMPLWLTATPRKPSYALANVDMTRGAAISPVPCDRKGNKGLPSEDYRLLNSRDAANNVPSSGF